MTALLALTALIPSAHAEEITPTIATVDLETAEVVVHLGDEVLQISGDLLDGSCTDGKEPTHCAAGGVTHVLLVDENGVPVHGFIGQIVESDAGSVVLAAAGLQAVSPRDAAFDTQIYGVWGTDGAALDLVAFDGIDGEAIWGTGGVAFDGISGEPKDRPTPVAIWGTGGVAIWGTGGVAYDGIDGESIWGTGGVAIGNDGSEAPLGGVWGTDAAQRGGETHWVKRLESTDLDVLLELRLAEVVAERTAVQMPFEEVSLGSLCEAFACK